MRGKAAGAAGAFGSGLFRGREATAPPVKITGGAAPSPPLALPLVFLLSSSPTFLVGWIICVSQVRRKEARRIGSTAGFFFLRRAEGE